MRHLQAHNSNLIQNPTQISTEPHNQLTSGSINTYIAHLSHQTKGHSTKNYYN